MADSNNRILGKNPFAPTPRTPGPLGTNGDAGSPDAPWLRPWWLVGNTPGPLGRNDHADPDTTMCRLRSGIATSQPTLADWRQGKVKKFEFEELETMSTAEWGRLSSAAERKAWILKKLGPYENQFHESAEAYQLPVQLLAVIVANELLDINLSDVAQEAVETSTDGSFGIAQIQVSTAIKNKLIPQDELYRFVKGSFAEGLFVKGRLRIPQFAINAAAKEIRIQLDRMKENKDSAWLKEFKFSTQSAGQGQEIYAAFAEGTQEDKEANLAQMVAAAYNSPDIIITKDLARYTGARTHGTNAGTVARVFYMWKIFRPLCP